MQQVIFYFTVALQILVCAVQVNHSPENLNVWINSQMLFYKMKNNFNYYGVKIQSNVTIN
jgi:hypothetical protein